jgi:hypothetical protein
MTTTTSTTAAGKLPTTWDDARDSVFFRSTARLLSPFCLGAGVRLAGLRRHGRLRNPEPSNSTAVPTGVDVDLTPVRVRRTA